MPWISAEIPPDIPVACLVRAAEHYKIPAVILVSVLKVEGGKVGGVYPRSSGTYYGPYQISGLWLTELQKWGFTAQSLQHDACANVTAGAYVLAYYKAREPGWDRALARYNVGSLKTQAQTEAGARYVAKVFRHWDGIHRRWMLNPAEKARHGLRS